MPSISNKIIDAARLTGARLADRNTPFLFEFWYIAAFTHEVGEALMPRTILGRRLVLFRSQGGGPVALSDRCVHRSYPLSKSRRDGDTIVCGYHGLRYDADGKVIEVPGQKSCIANLGVRAYPVREQGSLVWIWMGEGEPAVDLPLGDWVEDSKWPAFDAYFHLPASYIALHENLLDLSHLSFLHAGTFGTPDYAFAPYEIDLNESAGRFSITRTVSPTRLPPVWAEPTGLTGRDAVRISQSRFLSPAAHIVTGRFRDVAHESSQHSEFIIRTAHLATPETETSTHYFVHHGRNFCRDDDRVTEFMRVELSAAFEEDVEGLALVEQMVADTGTDDLYEISLASDRPGVAMRRWLKAQVKDNQD